MAMRTAMLVLLLGIVGFGKGYAYDFYSVCPTGQTLFYNIIDAENHFVELTCPYWQYDGHNWNGYTKPSGFITLPETVTRNGQIYTVTRIGSYAFVSCFGLLGDLVIPSTVTSIGEYAFSGCSGFDGTLTIPNSVTSIERGAFYTCLNLSGTLTIPEGITTISSETFYFCQQLTDVVIPNSVTNIGYRAFFYCTGFASLNLPNSLIGIGTEAFYHCTGLIGDLVIPNSVTTIDEAAFCECSGINGSLVIGNSVTVIGRNAFQHCEEATSLIIPNSVTTINDGAFYFCLSLTGDLNIPNSVTYIGQNTFWACDLTSVTIPASLSTFYEGIFAYNRNLTTVNYNATSAELLTYNTNVNTYTSVFDGCDALSTFNIGENVVSIPAKLLRRTSWSSGINNLSVINSYASVPPMAEENAFISVPENVNVYVPSCSLEEYQNASQWSSFMNLYATLPCFCIFTGNGGNALWSNPANWTDFPSVNGDVVINAECVLDVDDVTVNEARINMGRLIIPSGRKLTVLGEMVNYGLADNLVIMDSGQLLHHSDGVRATVMKTLSNYDAENNGWHLMASPMADAIAISSVQNLTSNEFDLYYYDESELYWMNQKLAENNFNTLESGKGYLYANSGCVLYDFDDGLEGWTTIDANGDSFDWMHSHEYSSVQTGAQIDNQGHNASYGCAVSESYVNHRIGDPLSSWYMYDNGVYETNIGTGGGTFYWGIKLPAGSFSAPYLFEVAVYDCMAMTGTLSIYNDGDNSPSSLVTSTDVSLYGTNSFRYFMFHNPVPIDPTKNVWVVFYNASGATHPAAASLQGGEPNGRWISTNGVDWDDIADFGLNYTFMVRAHLGYSGYSVIPDNYLVSPRVEFSEKSKLSFWVTDGNNAYGNEYFGVAVSTNGNTDASDFTTISSWSFNFSKKMSSSSRQLSDGIWYKLDVDLSDYEGQTGYVAIRHYGCADQWLLCVDDVMFENVAVIGAETEYLMEPVTLAFAGTLNNGITTLNIPLNLTGNEYYSGFNLVGNPFAHDVTSYSGSNVAEGCFRMNETQDDIVLSEISEANPLKPAEGFFVKAIGNNAAITFNGQEKGKKQTKIAYVSMELCENDKLIDRLVIQQAGAPLEKMSLRENRTKLYAETEQGEMSMISLPNQRQAVGFHAAKEGTYTIRVARKDMEINYFHLFDNLTGNDIDLLVTPSYTFEAKTTDPDSRFRLDCR